MQLAFFIRFTILFFLFAIVGTLSHELGHWLVARALGYDARIHFASNEVLYLQDANFKKMMELQQHNSKAILSGSNFRGRNQYRQLSAAFWKKQSLIIWGGVIQTLLVSFLCVLLILRRRKLNAFLVFNASYFNLADDFLLLGALFSLRPLFNFITAIPGIVRGIMPLNSDEYVLANYYSLPPLSLMIVFSFVGLVVLIWTIFWLLPVAYRRVFCLAGIIGGISGFLSWMKWLGPLLIP